MRLVWANEKNIVSVHQCRILMFLLVRSTIKIMHYRKITSAEWESVSERDWSVNTIVCIWVYWNGNNISINQKWMMLNKQLVRRVHIFFYCHEPTTTTFFVSRFVLNRNRIYIEFASQTKLSLLTLQLSWRTENILSFLRIVVVIRSIHSRYVI